jgi:2-polyprenyl-6-methoxyphenol hydroxylase-like FAD-dependent oxidoreductase
MSPFAGNGVNPGMKDALELAEAITENIETSRDLDSAVEQFEMAMFPRMEDVMASKTMMKTFQFRDDAPLEFIEKIRELMGGIEPELEMSTE